MLGKKHNLGKNIIQLIFGKLVPTDSGSFFWSSCETFSMWGCVFGWLAGGWKAATPWWVVVGPLLDLWTLRKISREVSLDTPESIEMNSVFFNESDLPKPHGAWPGISPKYQTYWHVWHFWVVSLKHQSSNFWRILHLTVILLYRWTDRFWPKINSGHQQKNTTP